MIKGTGNRKFNTGIACFFLLAFAAMAVFAAQGQAYERYNSGCQGCHGAFTDSTSPKGTVFPSGSKHEMHRASAAMDTDCNLCHTSSDGRNPFLGSSDGVTGIPGRGCTGCHDGNGLRAHHAANGVTVCSNCHSAGTLPAENTNPPYYGTTGTKANNACNPVAQANINENWSIGDFEGLDNDGDNLYDTNDPDCQSVPAGAMSVSPAGGLASTGSAGGPFSPSSQAYTLSNPGGASIDWTAAATQSWVTLSSSGGTLAAGATTTVTVSVNADANSLAEGGYSDNVTFTNTTNGTGNTTRPVSLTVNAATVDGAMSVSPAGGLTSTGAFGGPFTPSSETYTLSNTGSAPIDWTAAKTQSWVTLSAASGTLAAGTTTTVAVSINGGANTLAAGSYSDTVTFANTTNGTGNTTRAVSLTVTAAPVTPGGGSSGLSTDSSGGGCAVAPGRTSGGAGTVAPLFLLLIGSALRRLRKPGRRK